jgi:hypothetical protein
VIVIWFCIVLYIDNSSRPSLVSSFKVMNDMSVHIYDSERQRDVSELMYLLGTECKLSRWSQFPECYMYSPQERRVIAYCRFHIDVCTEATVNTMKELIRNIDNHENNRLVPSLNFLMKQIQLLYLVVLIINN